MALLGSEVTRFSLYGGIAIPYGSFAGKSAQGSPPIDYVVAAVSESYTMAAAVEAYASPVLDSEYAGPTPDDDYVM